MKNEVVISDYHELLALHRSLIEAKFHPNPEDFYISGSPFIANISNRVVNALINIDTQKDPAKKRSWEDWLDIDNQKWVWEQALAYASEFAVEYHGWNELDSNQKKDYVVNLFAPFRAKENHILSFINELDSKLI